MAGIEDSSGKGLLELQRLLSFLPVVQGVLGLRKGAIGVLLAATYASQPHPD